jgi:hypothetical protein
MCPTARLLVRSIVCLMGTYGFVFPMITAFWSYAGLQTCFRTFDTGFICASAIGY